MLEKLFENIKDIKLEHVLIVIICFYLYASHLQDRDLKEAYKIKATQNFLLERKIDSLLNLRVSDAYQHGIIKGKEEYINKMDTIWNKK